MTTIDLYNTYHIMFSSRSSSRSSVPCYWKVPLFSNNFCTSHLYSQHNEWQGGCMFLARMGISPLVWQYKQKCVEVERSSLLTSCSPGAPSAGPPSPATGKFPCSQKSQMSPC